MTSQNPIEQFLNKLTEFLRLANIERKKQPTGKMDPAVEERLAQLEHSVQVFKQLTEETLKQAGVQEEQIQRVLAEEARKALPAKDRMLLEKSAKLEKEVKAISQELSKEVVIAKQKQKYVGKTGKTGQSRKKRFRPMGGNKDWKPL